MKETMMKEAEVRTVELDDVEEPSDADLDALDDETIEKMLEEFSIDALLEELLYG